jgi:hypothetical protein
MKKILLLLLFKIISISCFSQTGFLANGGTASGTESVIYALGTNVYLSDTSNFSDAQSIVANKSVNKLYVQKSGEKYNYQGKIYDVGNNWIVRDNVNSAWRPINIFPTQTQILPTLRLPVQLSPLPAVPTGNVDLYAVKENGQYNVQFVGEFGDTSRMQRSLWRRNVTVWQPAGGTAINAFGINATIVTGITTQGTLTGGTELGELPKIVYTSAATAGALISMRTTQDAIFGSRAWEYGTRFSITTLQAGNRFFAGVTGNSNVAPTNIDPLTSTTQGKIGLAFNTNTGNLQLIHNVAGTAPTVTNLGTGFGVATASTLYELQLYHPPASTTTNVTVTNVTTGAVFTATISTNQPPNTQALGMQMWMTNNATAAAVSYTWIKTFFESR